MLDEDLRVCATDFDGNMKANLFVPFGMTSSGYLYREGMARPHVEKGNMLADRKATPIEAARYGDRGFDAIIANVVRSEPMQRFLPVTLS